MKAETIAKKYEHIRFFADKLTNERPTILEKLEELFTRGYIRPQYEIGRGRFTKLNDIRIELRDALNRIGIAYVEGNDAPRGGRTGDWMCLKADGVWEVFDEGTTHFRLRFNSWRMIAQTTNYLPAQVRDAYIKMIEEVNA